MGVPASLQPVSGLETLAEDGTECLTQGTMAGRASWHLSNQCWNNLGGRMASMYRSRGQEPGWESRVKMVGGRMVPRRRLQPGPQSWNQRPRMVGGRILPVSVTDSTDRTGRRECVCRRQDRRNFLTTSSDYGDFLERTGTNTWAATERAQPRRNPRATDSVDYGFAFN